MFLEVTDSSANNGDWSCFVSHRLSVVNQRSEDKSVAKESQNRYSKQAKDWGWREFVTLTSLFDLDAGFLVNDCVMFAAEVLVLRENSELKVNFLSYLFTASPLLLTFVGRQPFLVPSVIESPSAFTLIDRSFPKHLLACESSVAQLTK